MTILLILLSTFVIALLSVLGMLFFGEKGHVKGTHRFIVPFAVGAFLAITFFELIPETLKASQVYGSVAIVAGFLLFYFISNILHTYHHHHDCHSDDGCGATRVSALLLLWGDFVHNITDGVVIASAFIVNPTVGIVTSIGVALHEIPQEIAEFGVLRSAGYSNLRAAALNFLSATGVFVGAGLTVLLAAYFSDYLWVFMGVAAGNLLYVAASDLLPGVHRDSHTDGSFLRSFIATVIGVVVVGFLIVYAHENFTHFHPEDKNLHLDVDSYIHEVEGPDRNDGLYLFLEKTYIESDIHTYEDEDNEEYEAATTHDHMR